MKIEGFSRYFIDVDGSPYIIKEGIIHQKLKQRYDRDGFLRSNLYHDDGKKHVIHLHKLCAQAYGIYDPCEDLVVSHLDGIITNNHISNLECVPRIDAVLRTNIIRTKKDGLPYGIHIDPVNAMYYYVCDGYKSELFRNLDDAYLSRNAYYEWYYNTSETTFPSRRPAKWEPPENESGVILSFK